MSLHAGPQQTPFDLARFVTAQAAAMGRATAYETATAELRRGAKSSHWMWFIFPQLRGLGHSEMARHYGLASLDEAKAYLDHAVLGPRLATCADLVRAIEGGPLDAIFPYPDDLKLISCMTLFEAACAEASSGFAQVLDTRAGGNRCAATLRLLRSVA